MARRKTDEPELNQLCLLDAAPENACLYEALFSGSDHLPGECVAEHDA
ncbi:hypothetical protein [Sorangium sp. So ce1151]